MLIERVPRYRGKVATVLQRFLRGSSIKFRMRSLRLGGLFLVAFRFLGEGIFPVQAIPFSDADRKLVADLFTGQVVR